MSEVTLMLDAVAKGNNASEDLLPLVYEELRRLAAVRMAGEMSGHTLQPTALFHEAWLQLVGSGERSWQNRAHFFGGAADAMRRILIDKARRKARIKHGGGQSRIDIQELSFETRGILAKDSLKFLADFMRVLRVIDCHTMKRRLSAAAMAVASLAAASGKFV